MKVGDRIKEARKKAKLTQKQLGDKLNISQATISEFESKDNVRLDTLMKISEALDIPVEFLLHGYEHFNDKFKDILEEEHISLKILSKKTNIKLDRLQLIQEGKTIPTPLEIHALADKLSLPVYYFSDDNEFSTNTFRKITKENRKQNFIIDLINEILTDNDDVDAHEYDEGFYLWEEEDSKYFIYPDDIDYIQNLIEGTIRQYLDLVRNQSDYRYFHMNFEMEKGSLIDDIIEVITEFQEQRRSTTEDDYYSVVEEVLKRTTNKYNSLSVNQMKKIIKDFIMDHQFLFDSSVEDTADNQDG